MSLTYLLLIFLKLLTVGSDKWDCADYYWRDYHGVIPDDAIPAGKDTHGNTLYIGLAYIRGYELLPGTILPDEKVARTTAYAYVFNTKDNVKSIPRSFRVDFY
ncbi:uncharacterized protein LOC123003904 isoform X2 [Tribolium madens]|uniref:uncharacterized protein LOC123003904 isoform X2 n=1 Tax=Tribolium madens TaxID=41895 RepID=UPI001CF74A6E|nr:uncharacterized protein LOC123003904 isoform X2 [Tribolium madens]